MKKHTEKRKMTRKRRKTNDPTKFLTSQVKLDVDAVKLVRKVREEFR
jgi:hypothetical protein